MVDRLVQVLQPPAGILFDIDGTLSPIAPTPAAASVPEPTRAMLQRLAGTLALVAAISGRSAEDARRLVGVPGMVYAGNHGLEIAREGMVEPIPGVAQWSDAVQNAVDMARRELDLPGLVFEPKGLTASIHYRQAPDPAAAERLVGDLLRRLAGERGLRLTRGRMVWEIRPPVDANKGTAARWLVEEYRLSGVVFCGDDLTDVDAFDALRSLRQADTCRALNVAVLADDTPAEVRDGGDLQVDGTEGLAALLENLAERLSS
jgi:trehalose 6-phosphate phosphatase